MRRWASVFALLLAVLVTQGCGSQYSGDSLQTKLDDSVGEGKAVGIFAALAGPKDEFFSAGQAKLSGSGSKNFQLGYQFRIGSVSKAFNAVVVLKLVENGDLKLDDTVGQLLSQGFYPYASKVTVRQLLNHTSGIPDYTKQKPFLARFGKDPKQPWTPSELVGFVNKLPLEFEPGSDYRYSDTDNIVLGLIVEKVSGQSYRSQLHELVLRPLGLQHTYLPQTADIPAPHSNGYQYPPGGKGTPEDVTSAINPTGAWASGGMISTPGDLNHFLSAVIGGDFLKAGTRKEMFRTVAGTSSPPDPGSYRAGLGIFKYKLPCGEVWGHTGSIPGYRTIAVASPDGSRGAVVYVNTTELPDEAEDAVVAAQTEAICSTLEE